MNDEIQRQLHDERYVTRLVSSYSHLRNYLVNGSQWTLNVFFKNGRIVLYDKKANGIELLSDGTWRIT